MGLVVNATPRQLYPRERAPVLITQEAVWVQEHVRTGAENLLPPRGFKQRTYQTVASYYANYTISAPNRPCF
jgi:hypothetical protein